MPVTSVVHKVKTSTVNVSTIKETIYVNMLLMSVYVCSLCGCWSNPHKMHMQFLKFPKNIKL